MIDDEERWVERRVQYLTANEIGLRKKVAETVAYKELGYTSSGIAKRIGVGESTALNYLDTASKRYPGICLRTILDIDGNPEAGVDDLRPGPTTECPVCLKDRLLSGDEAQVVHKTSAWGATSMIEDADVVCEFCHAVRIDGEWKRAESASSRARTLAQSSSSKTKGDYVEMLTRGIDPSKAGQSGHGVDNSDELEW